MDYRISCLLNLFLTELLITKQHLEASHPNTDYNFVEKTCIYLQENLDKVINFNKISHELGISRSIFYRQFRIHTGFTPGEYLLQQRMNKAKLLLKTTSLSIEEIATQTGYLDAGHFSQIFKKHAGIVPSKYRKL